MVVRGELEMDQLSYLCDEQAWVRALDYAVHAETAPTLKKRLQNWLSFFPDAAAVVDGLLKASYPEWMEFRRGFQAERDGRFAGVEWAKQYGHLLMPDNAIKATELSGRLSVPWGAAVIRLRDLTEGAA